MKTCVFCKEPMQDGATACPHCGKPAGAVLKMQQGCALIALALMLAIAGFVIYAYVVYGRWR